MDVLPACMSVHHVCAVPTEVGVRSSRAGVVDGCESPHGCWGAEPRSSGRVVSALAHLAFSPALSLGFFTESKIILFPKDRWL